MHIPKITQKQCISCFYRVLTGVFDEWLTGIPVKHTIKNNRRIAGQLFFMRCFLPIFAAAENGGFSSVG
ncbi:MAG: hypothetical protein EOO05_15140 [Chitinophagaceae bacterium]|nr:MAG: hypothetical protein EOO05_15140 [Chitinophagaceae bacterium]